MGKISATFHTIEHGAGTIFLILAFGGLIIGGFASTILCLAVLANQFNFIVAFLAFMFFPILLTFTPFYAVIALGYWLPLIVEVATLLWCGLFFILGESLSEE